MPKQPIWRCCPLVPWRCTGRIFQRAPIPSSPSTCANGSPRKSLASSCPPCTTTSTAMMKGYPGAISISPDVLIQMYDSIFRECARHGFRKIFAAVCHGGSEIPVQFLANIVHERATAEAPGKPDRPDYYLFSKTISIGAAKRFAKEPEGRFGHGGEIETGLNIAARP